jgi:hypothetical protein
VELFLNADDNAQIPKEEMSKVQILLRRALGFLDRTKMASHK